MVCTEWCLIGLLDALFADCICRLVSQYDCRHRWNLDSHADLILIGPEIMCEKPQFPDIWTMKYTADSGPRLRSREIWISYEELNFSKTHA